MPHMATAEEDIFEQSSAAIESGSVRSAPSQRDRGLCASQRRCWSDNDRLRASKHFGDTESLRGTESHRMLIKALSQDCWPMQMFGKATG